MERLTTVGRIFFAAALIGLGVTHFVFQDFMTGRAPAWPPSVPGGTLWAYGTGAAFVGLGTTLLIGREARLAALLVATLIFAWALLRHVPVVATDSLLAPTWTAAGKALVFVGGALSIAATQPPLPGGGGSVLYRFVNLEGGFLAVGRISLGAFMIVTGVQHYMYTPFVASLIPGWFPGDAVLWTWFAGVALIAGGAGLQVPRTARPAALLSGLMVFSWFWIVHLPRTFANVSDGLAVFEALAVAGIAFVLAGGSGAVAHGHAVPVSRSPGRGLDPRKASR